jgi:hypothetical protein
MMLPRPPAAQSHPAISNIILDGGRYAIRAKVQAINATARTMTVMTDANRALPLVVARGIDLQGITTGNRVSEVYNRPSGKDAA